MGFLNGRRSPVLSLWQVLRPGMSALLVFLYSLSVTASGVETDKAMRNVSSDKVYEIAKEVYLYTYPMVENYYTMYQFALNKASNQYKGPINTINNVARVFTPEDTAIVTPNSDTLYSYLVMDLRAEPIVVTMPAIEKDRYYALQIIDLYTHNIDYIGTRKDGNEGGVFLLTGPDWHGEKPEGIKRVVAIPTELALGQFRTQLFNDKDLERVQYIQRQYKAELLSHYLGKNVARSTRMIDYPRIDREKIETNFWDFAGFLLQFASPLKDEAAFRQSFKEIGLISGQQWPAVDLSTEMVATIERARADSYQEITTGVSKLTTSAGLFGSPQFMAHKYYDRAIGAMSGLYGNTLEETLYLTYILDEKNQPLDTGQYNYTLTFTQGLPPVQAFWSVSLYDAKTRLLVTNPLNRYLINSAMLPDLKRDAEGNITIYIQHKSPGTAFEANWLPGPRGPIFLMMRLYLPQDSALKGYWVAPPLKITESSQEDRH